MMPLKLTMVAFGPYVEEQTLDFSAFQEERFFLIHGPTGSGKSTLLDAMVFALYGDSSGGQRRASQLRSDHAPADRRTEVILDFALGAAKYRIIRHPEWLREKRRGEGTVREDAQAVLYRLSDDLPSDDLKAAKVLVTGAQKVTRKIVELVGFESDQFRQVVCLPQNQFGKFLLSGSREREALLEMLFRTERYRRLQDRLEESAKTLAAEARDLAQKRQGILLSVGVETAEALGVRANALVETRRELSLKLELALSEKSAALARLEHARALARRFAEVSVAGERLAALNSKKEEVSRKKQELVEARKAIPLVEKEALLENYARQCTEAESLEKRKRLEAASALESLQNREIAWRQEEQTHGARVALEMQWQRLVQRRESILQWETSQKTVDRLTTELTQAKRARDGAEKAETESRAQLEALREEQKRIETKAAQVEWLRPQLRAAEEEDKTRAKLAELEASLLQTSKTREEKKTALSVIKKKGEAQRTQLQALEKNWLESQTATLAAQLQAGTACPVCGSEQHPSPARWEGSIAPSKAPSRETLLRARAEMETLEKSWLQSRTLLDAEEKKFAVTETQMFTLRETLRPEAEGDLSTIAGETGVARLKRCLAESQTAEVQLPPLLKNFQSLTAQLHKATETKSSASATLEKCDSESQSARALLENLRGSLGNDAIGIAEWEQRTRTLEAEVHRRKQAFESARKDWEQAALRRAAAEQGVTSAAETVARLCTLLEAQREHFRQEVGAAGFSSIEEYQAARRVPELIEKITTELSSYHGELSAAETGWQRAMAEVEGQSPPDLVCFEKAAQEWESHGNAAAQEKGAVETTLSQLQKSKAELASLGLDLANLEARYQIVGRLAEVAKGDNPLKINFQRYVLAAFLEEILEAASHRLQQMSKGRFHLRRALKSQDGRISGGLELEVEDAYTGANRPVSTLSGGEGFLASLALALGLSDVVQANAGGIHLDTLFIDEGFGTLDPESLDLALRTLMDLQKSGRLVGIISHVPELQGLIRAKIQVLPERGGSRARVTLG